MNQKVWKQYENKLSFGGNFNSEQSSNRKLLSRGYIFKKFEEKKDWIVICINIDVLRL